MGNNYRKVDLTDNAVVNVGAIYESTESNISTYSTNTTTNSTAKTLYTFQSDEIGNITNVSGVVDLEWNGRRLESISQSGTEVLSYKYNIDGQRVSKTVTDPETNEVTTTEYFYNGSILAGQKTGENVLIFMYDNNGDVFGFTYNGTPYYYVKNAQNDVFLILDETGMIQVLYQYDSWGKLSACYDATDFGLAAINPIMYRSYYVDLEMGFFMYYLNSRYYMADWGRFISADTTDILSVQSDLYDKNLFAYCDNNPVVRVDVSGYAWETVFDIASLCLSMAEVAVNPADAWAWIGLAADFVDLVPFVTGLGEVVRAVKVSNKAIDAVDTVSDAGKIISKVDDAPIVIGENMTRVRNYANQIGGKVYSPWKLDDWDKPLSLSRNKRWINDMQKQGKTIIDIGPDFARRRTGYGASDFYEMERTQIKNYSKYQSVFTRSGIYGGLPWEW